MLSNGPIIYLGRFFNEFSGVWVLIFSLAFSLSTTISLPGKADSSDFFSKDEKAAAAHDTRIVPIDVAATHVPYAGSTETAGLEPSRVIVDTATPLPRLLSAEDEGFYRRIFLYQESGEWKVADRIIAQLNDRILMGHVLYQRYMHPTKYRSKYEELRDWMALYADHPRAQKIYNLALKRRPENYKYPKKPVGGYFYGRGIDPSTQVEHVYVSKRKHTKNGKARVEALKRSVKRYVRRGGPTKAKKILDESPAHDLLDTIETDHLLSAIAAGYFAAGKDALALGIAGAVVKRSGMRVPRAHWTAGLASWRLGHLLDAARHFEILALSDMASDWNVAAAAYWAARGHLLTRQPQKVNHWLNIAALHSRTFYGLLARRSLGLSTYFNWETPTLTESRLARLTSVPNGSRALALLQLDRHNMAEKELRKIYPRSNSPLASAILAVATSANLPGLAMRIGSEWGDEKDNPNDGALYPMPNWAFSSSKNVDKALVFAIIRQESRFDPNAKSYTGARGLMQIMPRTANFIAGKNKFRGKAQNLLLDPELNISLGKTYLQQLLNHKDIGGDLFLLTVAYNSGPGNLAKWQRKMEYHDDPLLFIESIPNSETRAFIERVMANLWIYRKRLDQPTPSLDAIATGDWPLYTPLDGTRIRVAKHGRD
ncbi:MAG: lytic transglycosylase domain-containing protein [Alphaproteobacteria bacterium]|nr:lytic transglycosylase domain-containing protein [Alphaproteobacteria bacterium]